MLKKVSIDIKSIICEIHSNTCNLNKGHMKKLQTVKASGTSQMSHRAKHHT